MAGFRFRLEVVQGQRRQAVDMCRRDVALALRAVQETEIRLETVNTEIEIAATALRHSRGVGTLDIQSLARLEIHHGQLRRQREEAMGERDHRRVALEEKRRRLAVATKNLKVIEKLREKQWTRYEQDRKRRESAEYDEFAVQQFLRDTSPGKLSPGECEGPPLARLESNR